MPRLMPWSSSPPAGEATSRKRVDEIGDGLEDGLPGGEGGLLRDARELQPGRGEEIALVGPGLAAHDAKQARLAGAVAADEPDALARLDHQVGMVEERDVPVGEGDGRKLEEGHCTRAGGVACFR